MPPPAAATSNGMESVGWWALSFASEGVLLNGSTLQLGFKSEFRGHSARMGIYYGNQTANPMSAITAVVQLPPSAQGSLALSVQPGPTALPPRGQALQMAQLEFLAPFAEPPILRVQYTEAGAAPQTLSLALPVLPLRFFVPWRLAADQYFAQWRAAGLVEKQLSFQYAGAYDAAATRHALSDLLRLAVLDGVDPVATNVCAAGALALKGAPAPPAAGCSIVLLRLEVNAAFAKAADGTSRAAARLTVRASPRRREPGARPGHRRALCRRAAGPQEHEALNYDGYIRDE